MNERVATSDMVGLVGAGAMGVALIARLRLAGKSVRAYDTSPERLALARDGGAETVDSPAAAACGAPYVHIFVASDEQVIESCLGPAGALAGAAPGTVVFLHSTILPATTRRVAEAAAGREIEVLDAAVTAVPARVQEGEAVFLVGGPDAVVHAARPHLLALGRDVQHFGPLGAGNVAKLAKNMINAAERVTLSEALAMTEMGGIDARQFLEMLRASDSGSAIARWEKMFTVAGTHADPKPATNLFNKDVLLADRFAQDSRLDLPMVRGAAATAVRWVRKWAESRR
jgi:3-hydroxyisobutyrate dehydrogenase-like beta-hydroxyacid dehydrogenase